MMLYKINRRRIFLVTDYLQFLLDIDNCMHFLLIKMTKAITLKLS